jgi:hypothetical protein
VDASEQLKAYEQIAAKAARAKLLRFNAHGVIVIALPTPGAAPAAAPSAPVPAPPPTLTPTG